MQTPSFMIKATKIFGPEPSLVPLFVEALDTGQKGGNDPQDVFKNTLMKSSPELVQRILDGWQNTPQRKRPQAATLGKQRRQDQNDRSWHERVQSGVAEYTAYHAAIKRYRKSLIRAEMRRALEIGVQNWTPSDSVRADKTLLYEVSRAIWADLSIDCCAIGVDGDPPPTRPVYGVRLSRIKCRETDEVGHDEVYVITIAVDGAGSLKADTSPKYSMNDSDANVRYPNRFIYAPLDPKGFLDVAIELWEDDGGYDAAAKAIAGLAAAVAAAGTVAVNPWVIGAGAALGLIAGLVGIAGLLDHNDRYGQDGLSWVSDADLAAGVGPYMKSFVNKDDGIFDFTQWNYDVQFDLVHSPA